MLKLLSVGLWSILVLVGTYFGANHFKLFSAETSASAKEPKIETITTSTMRVPIMSEDKAVGYALLDLSIDYDAALLGAASDKFKDVAVDETFRAVYEAVGIDFKRARKTDLTGLLKEIGERLNKRLGDGTVKEIRVKEFMFVPPRKVSS